MRLRRSARIIATVLALSLGASTAAVAADEPDPPALSGGSTVTLITGDRVTTFGDSRNVVQPGPGRENIHFTISRSNGHLYVIPSDAGSLVSTGAIDKRLFDVTTLLADGYGDAASTNLPLLVTQTAGHTFAAPQGATVTHTLPSINGSALEATKTEINGLWNSLTAATAGNRVLSGGVSKVWLDGKRRVNLDRSARQIGAPQAWQSGFTGKGVTVAVLDTGVDQTHPDLKDREAAQQNFSDANSNVDHFGHGTHVAGIVAGTGKFSNAKYRGIAHGAKVLDGKVLNDSGSGKESWIIAGMQWAAKQKADIANLSLGGGDAPGIDPLEQAVNTLSADTETLFVISAGNSGPSEETIGSPGSADAALTVGAVNRKDGLAPFSSRGPRIGDGAIKPDITAPGTGIVSALHSDATIGKPIDGRYTALDGTSMASPHVAGAAALLAQARPNYTGEQLKATLTTSAKPNPELTPFEQGSGRLAVPAALAQQVTSSPTNVRFGTQLWPHHDDKPVSKPLTYHNNSKTNVTLDLSTVVKGPDGQAGPASLFTVDKPRVTVPAGGSAKVMVTTNTRLDAPDGVYSGEVVATAGKTRVRTPIAVIKEVESYNLTVNTTGPDGAPTSQALTTLFSGESDLTSIPTGKPSRTVRLPKGQYQVGSQLNTGGADNTHSYVLVQPTLRFNKDITLDLDFATTKPVRVTPPDPKAQPYFGSLTVAMPKKFGMSLLAFDINDFSTAQLGEVPPSEELITGISSQWRGKKGDYHLAWYERGTVPTGFRRDVGLEDVAKVRTVFGAPQPNRTGSRSAVPSPIDGPDPGASYRTGAVPLPGERDVFYSTEGTQWTGVFQQIHQSGFEIESESPPQVYQAGKQYEERFNFGPFAPALPVTTQRPAWAYRAKDRIELFLPLFSDGVGNAGLSLTAKGYTKLFRGEELVGESKMPGSGLITVAPDAGRYRLSTEATRKTELSSRVSASWTFDSGHTDQPQDLPLCVVRFDPKLDDNNSAPAGTHEDVPLFLQGSDGKPIPAAELAVQVSYDKGKTWVDAPVRNGKVALDYPADAGSVSLRATAADQQGNTVEQTVIGAYKLRS